MREYFVATNLGMTTIADFFSNDLQLAKDFAAREGQDGYRIYELILIEEAPSRKRHTLNLVWSKK